MQRSWQDSLIIHIHASSTSLCPNLNLNHSIAMADRHIFGPPAEYEHNVIEFESHSATNSSSDSSSATDSTIARGISLPREPTRYVEENGRRYHVYWTQRRYLFPNSERGQGRLDVQHTILLKINGLHKALLPAGIQNALDLGTGTGIWPKTFVHTYPSAIVTGLDLSDEILINGHMNCEFFVEDIKDNDGLGGNFDYVHARFLHGTYNWPYLIKKVFNALAPGSTIEIKEFQFPPQFHDPNMAADSAIMTWSRTVIEGASKIGLDLTTLNEIPQILKEAGFKNVNSSIYAWPMGT
jgi:SAM-dependent methyltransferase